MIKFEGLEIFRAGDYGELGSFSEQDIEEIAAEYDPSKHEAPIVKGHPEIDAPAFGWIKKLFRRGASLFADGEIVEELKDQIEQGLYRKVSAAIYKSFASTGKKYLRHLGFLGAVPPVVKGMAGIQFADTGEFSEFEFSESKSKEGEMPEPEKKELYSPEMVTNLIAGEVLKKENELTAKFNEDMKAKESEINGLKAKLAELEKTVSQFSEAADQVEIEKFVDGLISQGRTIPSMKDALVKQLVKTKRADAALFAETKANYEAAPKVVEFGENTDARGEAGGVGGKGSAKFADVASKLGLTDEDIKKYDGKEYFMGN